MLLEIEMNLTEDIKPITYLKQRASELVRQVNDTRRSVIITQNGEAKVVVIDIETYQGMRDAMLMLKLVAQGEAEARAGRTLSQDEALARVRGRLERP